PGQALDPAGTRIDGDEILDPHAHLAFEVDAGLDGEDRRAGQWRLGRESPERRCLVRRQSDPVPGPVAEMLAVAGGRDDVACDRIDGPAVRQLAVPARDRMTAPSTASIAAD